MANESQENPIFSSISNTVLAIITSAVLAIASLFLQNQITAGKTETKITHIEASIHELKADSKEASRLLEGQLQSFDARLRLVEQKR